MICNRNPESIEHLFLLCPWTHQIWAAQSLLNDSPSYYGKSGNPAMIGVLEQNHLVLSTSSPQHKPWKITLIGGWVNRANKLMRSNTHLRVRRLNQPRIRPLQCKACRNFGVRRNEPRLRQIFLRTTTCLRRILLRASTLLGQRRLLCFTPLK